MQAYYLLQNLFSGWASDISLLKESEKVFICEMVSVWERQRPNTWIDFNEVLLHVRGRIRQSTKSHKPFQIFEFARSIDRLTLHYTRVCVCYVSGRIKKERKGSFIKNPTILIRISWERISLKFNQTYLKYNQIRYWGLSLVFAIHVTDETEKLCNYSSSFTLNSIYYSSQSM